MTETERVASLQTRSNWAPIRDMYDAHLELTEGGVKIDISRPRKGSIAVWLWMARIALTLESGKSYKQIRDGDRNYVYKNLGRANGTTFLTETSPIPCVTAGIPHPHVADLARRSPRARLDALHHYWTRARPVTICYGTRRKYEFSSLLNFKWEPWEECNGRSFIDRNNRAFLLPFFGQGQMSHASMERFLSNPTLLKFWSEAGADNVV